MTRTTLNLGAGKRIDEGDKGAVNHDLTLHSPLIDVAHDLNDIPWPWDDESFDRVLAWAVLEHLRLNLIESINECWRVLRPGGTIEVKLPIWNAATSYDDPTHYWQFALGVFDQFDPRTERGRQYDFYTPRKWTITKPATMCSSSSFVATMEKLT